jgi:hypothetical protein
MTTATMPDWPSLWEREPKLIPRTAPGEHDTMGATMMRDQHGLFRWAGSWAPSYPPIFPSVVAALCRDAAVRQLRVWRKELCTAPGRVWGGDSPGLGAHPRAGELEAGVSTAILLGDDDDLYAACEAVLNARDGHMAAHAARELARSETMPGVRVISTSQSPGAAAAAKRLTGAVDDLVRGSGQSPPPSQR